MKKILLIIAFILILVWTTFGQQINTISSTCPSPNQLTKGSAKVIGLGDIVFTPCSLRSSIFNGVVNFSNATIVGSGFVTGTGTTNFIPVFTSATAIGNSPFSWNGTLYTFNNTALNSDFRLQLTPSTAAGIFKVGDFAGATQTFISITKATDSILNQTQGAGTWSVTDGNDFSATFSGVSNIFSITNVPITASFSLDANNNIIVVRADNGITMNSRSTSFDAGDVGHIANRTRFILDDAAQTFTFNSVGSQGIFVLTQITNYNIFRTITAAGTTGAQTIDKPNGTVNFAAGTNVIIVTNAVAVATSTIFVQSQTNDATCVTFQVAAKAAGSFQIRSPANCAAETPVAFWVWN